MKGKSADLEWQIEITCMILLKHRCFDRYLRHFPQSKGGIVSADIDSLIPRTSPNASAGNIGQHAYARKRHSSIDV